MQPLPTDMRELPVKGSSRLVWLSDQLETTVACVGAKRMHKARNGTAPGIVVVQFANKQDKVAVFKARGKLATTKDWFGL